MRAGLRDHLRSHVDADHAAGLADLARGEKRVESRAAPEVEHPFARLQFGDRLRVPTAEAQISPFGSTAGILDVPEYAVRAKRGDFEPLISEDLFYRVQAVLAGRVPSTTPQQRAHPDFPLRAFVRWSRTGG
jgi:hypothetical protein